MTREITVGNKKIGGANRVVIQSMTTADTADADKTAEQILRLEDAGCEIVRASVYDMNAAKAFGKIKEKISIPLVADVHFDYRLAIAAVENGADKLRINPGNITNENDIKKLVDCVKMHRIPIRIGVNGGSLSPKIRKKYGSAALRRGIFMRDPALSGANMADDRPVSPGVSFMFDPRNG